ncbi:MAG: hypothetical protein Q8P83_04240 [bacterium]|nr:hypothetical protein [bacterium]
MSKHNQISVRSEEEEQRVLKKDVISSLAWNAFFLLVLFVLFFVNNANGAIDNLFARLFNF